MRPIYLEIEGLQSYKTLQKIDFEKLIENGLFGIFGSTGSGKSTVLDAITLALYGKVSRASRGTQGIMNNECDRMRVMFEFSMLEKGTRNRYRIERVYSRKSETGYDIKIARMFRTGEDGDLPIAEKTTDIDNAVRELIGLEYEDFTRAVVLPQNKFQDFLTMEKSKKLAMLERLFGLSEYGEKLAESVKVKIYDLEKEYENVKGQLSAIEHSDDQAYANAKEKFAEKEKQREIAIARHKTVEEEYVKVKDLYETSVNIIKLENELKESLSETDYFERLKSKVMLSRKAKEIEPLWDTYKKDAGEKKQLEKMAEEFSVKLENTVELLERTENRKNIAMQNADISLPKLYDKKAKLEQGTGLQIKFDSLTESIAEKEEKAEQLKETLLKVTESKNKAQIRKNEINVAIGEFDEFFSQNKPKLARRTLLLEGQKFENEAIKAAEKSETLKNEHERILSDVRNCERDIEETGKVCTELVEKYEKRRASVESTINQYKSIKADYLEEKAKIEEEMRALLQEETAYRIAQKLEDAVPCPVCGSMHHPSPAELNEESAARIEECKAEIEGYEQHIEDTERIILGFTNGYNNEQKAEVLIEIETLNRQIAAAETKLELLGQQLETLKQRCLETEKAYEQAEKESISKKNVLSRFKLENNLGEIASELAMLSDIEEKINSTEKDNIELCNERDALIDEFSKLLEKQGQLETEIAVTQSTAIEQKLTLREVENQLAEIVSEGTVYDEIERVNGEISVLVKEKEDSAKQLEIHKQAAEQLQSDILVTKEKIQHKTEVLDENEKRILAVLEGTDINSPDIILQARLSDEMENNYNIEISRYEEKVSKLRTMIAVSREKLAGKTVTATEYDTVSKNYEKACAKRDEELSGYEVAKNELEKTEESHRKWKIVSESHGKLSKDLESFNCIKKLIAGNKFVEYVAEESLRYVLAEASEILSSLTRNRYRIELGGESEFIVKDYLAGGAYRGVGTLSGGETFLTSLSLAVALSKQIQLKGQSPLEFFFLDEGFGSLDGELLDTVINSLEKLSSESRVIGVVSHLKELQERIPRKLFVEKDGDNSSSTKLQYA